MRVGDLRLILAMLPDDMPINIATGNCCHVTIVQKRGLRTGRRPAYAARMHDPYPALVLRGQSPSALWFDPEPPWTMRGRWPLSKLTPEERLRIAGEEGP